MAKSLHILGYCIALLIASSGQTTAQSIITSKPLPPSQDPWYIAPENYTAAVPGDILRLREAPGDLCSIVANCSAAWNILYRTTDNDQSATWAVTTLLAPPIEYSSTSSKKALNKALLSYQLAIDSPAVDQQPSYLLYTPNATDQWVDFTAALGRGWFVSVPDYESTKAAFGAPFLEGQATLDNIRAVLNLARARPDIGLAGGEDVRCAVWGYSGGSIASEWAVELQGLYAPELPLAGAVLGGLVPNFTTVFYEIDGTVWAGDIPAGVVGVTVEDAAARAFVLSRLKTTGPYNATTFLSVLNNSVTENFAVFAGQNISDYFVGGVADMFAPILLDLYNAGQMGLHGRPGVPLFLYKAIADEFTPIYQTDELVAQFCAEGVDVLYERNTVGEHVSELANGHTRALDYLSMVFEATIGDLYRNQSCIVRNVSVVDSTGAVL
ncbi:LIP-domain-containing protein [Cryphonectria parasitica EP155]|uniref:LIP-domain-containing protein n=1 Tax=Cryphonectria parasitica (strain ATCC 38755 / EP155) TaxID=660469 RepID=A0A9P4Y5H8_CRYP1|nr:LIP-domain-containing protein [Cryphonectria parasitica EP155]KAF3767334.1 LIP-domain-containing protein [Cryphonectria parasitica EP155]